MFFIRSSWKLLLVISTGIFCCVFSGCGNRGEDKSLRIIPSKCNIYPLPSNTLRTLLFAIENRGSESVTVREITGANRYDFDVDPTIPSGKTGYLTLRLVLPASEPFKDRLTVVCESGGVIKNLPLEICNTEPGVENGHKTVVDEVIDLGRVYPGSSVKACATIHNQGEYPLVLNKPKVGCKCTILKTVPSIVESGEAADFEFEIKLPYKTGNTRTSGPMVMTNDPGKPILRFQVLASLMYPFTASPSSLNFGELKPGETKEFDVELKRADSNIDAGDITTTSSEVLRIVSSTCLSKEIVQYKFNFVAPTDKSLVRTELLFKDRQGNLLCHVPVFARVLLPFQVLPNSVSFIGIPESSVHNGEAFREVFIAAEGGEEVKFLSAETELDGLEISLKEPADGEQAAKGIRLKVSLNKAPEGGRIAVRSYVKLLCNGKEQTISIPVVIHVDKQ